MGVLFIRAEGSVQKLSFIFIANSFAFVISFSLGLFLFIFIKKDGLRTKLEKSNHQNIISSSLVTYLKKIGKTGKIRKTNNIGLEILILENLKILTNLNNQI